MRHDTQPFYIKFCNDVDENFQHDFVINMACISSQKLVSRILLLHKSLHKKRDIFCNELIVIFFMNIVAKPYAKRLTMEQLTPLVGNLFLYCGPFKN